MYDQMVIQLNEYNKDNFKQLYDKYKLKIYKTIYLITNDSSTAEDILQEVFIQVYLKINSLKNASAFEHWLYKITINCCMKNFKKNKRFGIIEDDSKFYNKSEDNITYLPEENLMKKEVSKEIWKLISLLPKYHRIPIILYYYNELSIKEISTIMKCSEGTVKSRLYYCKNYLKNALKNNII